MNPTILLSSFVIAPVWLGAPPANAEASETASWLVREADRGARLYPWLGCRLLHESKIQGRLDISIPVERRTRRQAAGT